MSPFAPGSRIHFAGIGGVGMSAMARILAARGCVVSGSDREAGEILSSLRQQGIRVLEGHHPGNAHGADLVIYTAALRPDNVEILEARSRGIPVMSRAEALGRMMESKRGIAISGTHGKTTTTAMTALALIQAGLDPTVMVGGIVPELGGNARSGSGPHFVAEADEFDRSFLRLWPTVAAATSVEEEHLDSYLDLADIRGAFLAFLNRVPAEGFVVVCVDDPVIRGMLPGISARRVTCGLRPEADVTARRVTMGGAGSAFTLCRKEEEIGSIRMRCPGLHNVRNALTAASVCLEVGVDFPSFQTALEGFGGVKRRFETLGEQNGILIIDDYAHHPTEVEAALTAARTLGRTRVVAVFQPHLYSRTRDFAAGFGKALSTAELIVVTDVYPARESPIAGVSGAWIAEAARRAGAAEVAYVPELTGVAPHPLLRLPPRSPPNSCCAP